MFGIPIPYLILAVCIALFGSYQGGYHFGWEDRDNDMKLAIAQKNDEARELEKNMTSKLSDQETKLRKAKDDIVKKVIGYLIDYLYIDEIYNSNESEKSI